MKLNIYKAFFILLLYSLFLLVFSTEIIIKEYMHVRREMRIDSPDHEDVKTILISKRFWNSLKNKKEFSVNETFYDLISFEEKNDTITARVVADDFEIVLKKTAQNLMKKNSKNKKSHTSISITSILNHEFKMDFFDHQFVRRKINGSILNKEDKYIQNIFQPPCFISII